MKTLQTLAEISGDSPRLINRASVAAAVRAGSPPSGGPAEASAGDRASQGSLRRGLRAALERPELAQRRGLRCGEALLQVGAEPCGGSWEMARDRLYGHPDRGLGVARGRAVVRVLLTAILLVWAVVAAVLRPALAAARTAGGGVVTTCAVTLGACALLGGSPHRSLGPFGPDPDARPLPTLPAPAMAHANAVADRGAR